MTGTGRAMVKMLLLQPSLISAACALTLCILKLELIIALNVVNNAQAIAPKLRLINQSIKIARVIRASSNLNIRRLKTKQKVKVDENEDGYSHP